MRVPYIAMKPLQERSAKLTIKLYKSGPGWQCEHTLTEPPWEGAILLCKQCEYKAREGAPLVDHSGKAVEWEQNPLGDE